MKITEVNPRLKRGPWARGRRDSGKITARPRVSGLVGEAPRTSDLGGEKVVLGGLGSLFKGVQALVVEV